MVAVNRGKTGYWMMAVVMQETLCFLFVVGIPDMPSEFVTPSFFFQGVCV